MCNQGRDVGKGGEGRAEKNLSVTTHILGISGGVSFFTYFPTTPSLIVLRSLFFRDNMFADNVNYARDSRCQVKAARVGQERRTTMRPPNLNAAWIKNKE